LRGDKPEDLPVQQPTNYQLVGARVSVPPNLLARTDE